MSNKVDAFLDKKLEEIQNKRFEENQTKIKAKNAKKEKNQKKRKGIIISAISLMLVGLIAVVGHFGFKKKNNNNANVYKPSIVTVDDLGVEEEFTSSDESKLYGDTTGDIKKEDLVEKDKVIYKDQEAADKSDQVGTSSIDLQGGQLEIDKDGDVVVKDEVDYVVKNEQGEEISSGTMGEDEIPEGYVKDEDVNTIVKEEDAGKFIALEYDYYDMNGELIYKKGEIVTKETYEKLKNDPNFTTVKSSVNTSSNNTSSNNTSSNNTSSNTTTSTTEKVEEGVVNADGTFTISGVTFKDKATYDLIASGKCDENNLRYDDKGVIYILQNTKSKVTSSAPSTSSNTTSSNTSSNTTSSNTSSNTSSTTETTEKVDEGVINPDGTFTITGVTFKDKATYEAIILGECNEEDLRCDEKGVIYIKENTSSKIR